MAGYTGRRRNGIIDKLPIGLRETVNQMLLSGVPYREIVEYLAGEGVEASRQAVCNYARKFLADTKMVHIAQDNFRVLTEAIERNPELDTSEAILRVISNSMLHTFTNMPEEAWSDVKLDTLLREANALIKGTAMKRRVDNRNRTEIERAFEKHKNVLFDSLYKDHPALYRQLADVLAEMLDEADE